MAVNETELCAGGYFPVRRESHFALGCDLGQSIDPSAIAIVERIIEARTPLEVGTDLRQRAGPPRFECRHLERLPLQTPYPAVIAHVAHRLSTPPLLGNCQLVLDATGVGRPVTDMFVQAGLACVAISITGGGDNERLSEDGVNWRVSKQLLISRLQALFHAGELKIARSLPEAKALMAELQDFRVNFSDAGFASFGARVGKHDDLVLALALAVWQLIGPWRNRITITQMRL